MIALLLAAIMILSPAASYATEAGGVSGNDKSVSDNDPRLGVPGPGFIIDFNANKPAKAPEDVVGEMEAQYVPFSSVSDSDLVTINENAYSLRYYQFVGWKCNHEGTIWEFEDKAEIGNLTAGVDGIHLNFVAQWKPIEYEIVYNLNGGINVAGNKASINIESGKLILATPKREGYQFLGWYEDEALTRKVTEVTPENLEAFYESAEEGCKYNLYAKWAIITYSIRFNPNGGSGKMNDINSISYSKKVTLPASTFTRKGMTFAGWNTRANGKGIAIANKASVSKLASTNGAVVNLYAQWTYTKYKITYSGLGSSGKNNKSNPSTYTIASGKITLKDPTKPGFKFQGWYKDKNFKKKITYIPAGSTGNITVYSKWTPNQYTLKFNANGGSGKMSKKTKIKYNESFKLPKNEFVKTGFVFKGWNTKKDGKGTSYSNKEKVSKLTTKNGGTVTLYAQWSALKYNIKFDGNGATSGKMSKLKNLVYGKSYKLPENKFKRNGYRFLGWNTQKDGKGIAFKDLAKVKDLTENDGETIVLYARWMKKTSKVYSDRELFDYFVHDGMTIQGAAGLLGNLKAESDLRANNLQNVYNESLRMTDEEYTEAVDDGTYTNFVYDQAGYGLAQWTSPGRKQALLDFANSRESSIGDTEMQLEFLIYELAYNYGSVYKTLQTTKSVKAASNAVLLNFEKPRDQSKAAQDRRAAIGTKYFKTFCPNDKPEPKMTMTEEDCPFVVKVTINNLSIRKGPGTNYERTGFLAAGDYKIVHVKSGTGSAMGWGQLESGGWIALDYATRIE